MMNDRPNSRITSLISSVIPTHMIDTENTLRIISAARIHVSLKILFIAFSS